MNSGIGKANSNSSSLLKELFKHGVSHVQPRNILKIKGPVYMRIGRGSSTNSEKKFDLKKNTLISAGKQGTIICTGPTVTLAKNISHIIYKKYGIKLSVLSVHTIKPIEKRSIINICKKTKNIFIIEEHQMIGGLRDIISSILISNGVKVSKFLGFGINDVFCSYNGTYEGIKRKYLLTEEFISKKILKSIK